MNADDSLFEAYIYETQQLLESLEDILFSGEHTKSLDNEQINEIFRIVHTVKGSSAMMEFDVMAKLSHAVEDMFSFIRDNSATADQWPEIIDLIFNTVSFLNGELSKVQNKNDPDGDASDLIEDIKRELEVLKGSLSGLPEQVTVEPDSIPSETVNQISLSEDMSDMSYYKIKVFFADNCQMENIRAFALVQSLEKLNCNLATVPADLDASTACDQIVSNGLCVYVQTTENPDKLKEIVNGTLFLKSSSLLPIEGDDEDIPESIRKKPTEDPIIEELIAEDPKTPIRTVSKQAETANQENETIAKQNFISVNVNKLDNLLNIVGEIVTAQSMVINNANFGELPHDDFDTAAQQLRSLIDELQDVVMNIRMIPVSTLFQKMRRLVREMSKKIGRDVDLDLLGEETEVDKNVIDSLSDPLLHIIRNSVDHGIEDAETRIANGKPPHGKVVLEAKMTGSDVIVSVSDDGSGLQRDAILKKAFEKGLIPKIDDDIPDKEVYSMIFLPGFSTNEVVTEYSGRGVGLDVVRRDISKINGTVSIESEPGVGTKVIICIPLTLTIVDGMKFNVGDMNFIVPNASVHSAVKPDPKDVFKDPEGNEMIMLLGNCYSLVRLKDYFRIDGGVTEISDGMVMHICTEQKEFCIFFDHLDGECQVVVKKLPNYISQCSTSLEGIGGCAILGDGSINLILEVNNL